LSFWRLAVRNLARNRRRTALTGGIVVFGFTAFALAGGFMAQSLEGLREGTIRSGTGHIQFAHPRAFESGEFGSLEHGLDEADRVEAALRGQDGVAEVLPRISFVGLASDGIRTIPFLGTGLDPVPEARSMDYPKTLAAGRWLTGRDERGVVPGTGLAAALGVGVGDTVTLLATTVDGTLNALDVEVVGLAKLPIKELDDRYVATSLGLASELLSTGAQVSRIVVVLHETNDTATALTALGSSLRAAGFNLTGKPWQELAPFYGQVRLLYMGIFGFMGIILVTIVVLACTNAMLITVTERTREIGTLRAIGTRAAAVRNMFIAEGAILALVGCIAGALLSLLVRLILNNSGIILPPPPGATQGSPLQVKIYGIAYGAGALVMLVTLVLASWIPARRAARVSIVEALTHV